MVQANQFPGGGDGPVSGSTQDDSVTMLRAIAENLSQLVEVTGPPVVPGGGVTSFEGRIGAVLAVAGDYTASEVTNDSGVAGATVADALNTLDSDKTDTQIFTSSGTYTPHANMKTARVRVQAPGGGSGGADGIGSGTGVSSGGAGGGEYAEGTLSAATIGASQAVTIGAPGAAGSNTGGNGGNGGTTSVGALITANGGTGGVGTGSDSTSNVPRAGGAGGTGGAGGDFRVPGQRGSDSLVMFDGTDSFPLRSGDGGDSQLGRGAQANAVNAWAGTPTAGTAGQNYGGGASGAIAYSNTGQAGAAGGPGIVIIDEFF